MSQAEVFIGIDLGTTTTLLARSFPAPSGKINAKVLEIEQGSNNQKKLTYLPSVAYFPENGNPLVGLEAEIVGPQQDLSRYVRAIKRYMGLELPFPVAGKQPRDVSALFLAHALNSGKKSFPEPKLVFTVTVPASFTSNQRADTLLALQKACTDAHLPYPAEDEDRLFISEPVAAMLAFLNDEISDPRTNIDFAKLNRFIVYDLGGGTLDLTRVCFDPDSQKVPDGAPADKLTDLNIYIEEISPYTPFGGEDFDRELAKWLHTDILQQYPELANLQLSDNERKAVYWQLMREAKLLKEKLSTEILSQRESNVSSLLEAADPEVEYDIEALRIQSKSYDRYNLKLTEKQYRQILGNLLIDNSLVEDAQDYSKNLLSPLKRFMAKMGLLTADLDGLLIVGGAARLPLVMEALKSYWNNKQVFVYNPPDHAVVKGAAIYSYLRTLTDFSLAEPAADAYYVRLKDTFDLLLQSKDRSFAPKKKYNLTSSGNRFSLQIFAGEQLSDGVNIRKHLQPEDLEKVLPTLIYQGSTVVRFGEDYPKDTPVWIQMHYQDEGRDSTKVPWVTVSIQEESNIVFNDSYSKLIHTEA